MKGFFARSVVPVLGVALFALAASSAMAADAVRYELTPSRVERAWVEEGPGGHAYVNVELAEVHKKDFSMLTSRILGRTLEVTFEGRVLFRGSVRERIDSGMIRFEADSLEEARSIGTDIGGGG